MKKISLKYLKSINDASPNLKNWVDVEALQAEYPELEYLNLLDNEPAVDGNRMTICLKHPTPGQLWLLQDLSLTHYLNIIWDRA